MSSDFGTDRTIKKSRKPHKCDECGRTIPTGSSYSRHAGVWEGDFFDFTSCLQCEDLREILNGIDQEFYQGMYGGVGPWFDEGLIREFKMTFLEALELERKRRAFQRQWTPLTLSEATR